MHLHTHRLWGGHGRCTRRVEPCDWSGGTHTIITMVGVSLQATRHNSSNVGGVTAGKVDTTLVCVTNPIISFALVLYIKKPEVDMLRLSLAEVIVISISFARRLI